MLQVISVILRALGISINIPAIFDLIPNHVVASHWNEVMEKLVGINVVICVVIFILVTLYYKFLYNVSTTTYVMWWRGAIILTILSFGVCVWFFWRFLHTVENMAVSIGELLFPIAFVIAIDCFLLYLVFSTLYCIWPTIIKKSLPPCSWFTKGK